MRQSTTGQAGAAAAGDERDLRGCARADRLDDIVRGFGQHDESGDGRIVGQTVAFVGAPPLQVGDQLVRADPARQTRDERLDRVGLPSRDGPRVRSGHQHPFGPRDNSGSVRLVSQLGVSKLAFRPLRVTLEVVNGGERSGAGKETV